MVEKVHISETLESTDQLRTIHELGDGLQSQIYLASDDKCNLVCVKLFKNQREADQINGPEQEYLISQQLSDCPNILNIHTAQR